MKLFQFFYNTFSTIKYEILNNKKILDKLIYKHIYTIVSYD